MQLVRKSLDSTTLRTSRFTAAQHGAAFRTHHLLVVVRQPCPVQHLQRGLEAEHGGRHVKAALSQRNLTVFLLPHKLLQHRLVQKHECYVGGSVPHAAARMREERLCRQ